MIRSPFAGPKAGGSVVGRLAFPWRPVGQTLHAMLWAVLFGHCLAAIAQADTIFTVNVDTSSLSPSGTYYIDFQLDTGFVSGNNTVVISNFGFGTTTIGMPVGSPLTPPIGAVSGDLGSAVMITDDVSNPNAGPVNDFTQQFAPGDSLTFHVDLSTNVVADPVLGLSSDQFTFAIQDFTGANLPTADTGPNNTIVTETIATATLIPPLDTPLPIPFDLVSPPGSATVNVTTATPVTLFGPSSAVPEPATLSLFAIGLVGFVVRRVRCRPKA